jgi:hypothetical protein
VGSGGEDLAEGSGVSIHQYGGVWVIHIPRKITPAYAIATTTVLSAMKVDRVMAKTVALMLTVRL